MKCRELIGPHTGQRCDRAGAYVALPCPSGRPDATACYCDLHGGAERAQVEAERDWNYLAPASVGGPADVEDAGCMGLQTTHAYVVVRQEPAASGGVWLAWLGLGGHMLPVSNPDGQRRKRGGRMGRYATSPPRSFPRRADALKAATEQWRRRLDERLWDIHEARGNTTSWGTPVEPLENPVVIVLEQGDQRSAWDVAVTLQRRSRAGVAALSGLRPSGECA